MKFENTEVWGFKHALRGMRNPMNSWDKSDSGWEFVEDPSIINPNDEVKFVIGENDMRLAQKLIRSGSEHRKFMRQIFVSVDITAPAYFMTELDTYKIGVTRNSSSFMHKGTSKEFEIEDFECDDERIYQVLSTKKEKLTNSLEYPYETNDYKIYTTWSGRQYEVYKNGRIFSTPFTYTDTKNRTRSFDRTEIHPSITRNGYWELNLGGRKRERWLLHRLIAYVWIPNIEGYETVDHIDNNKNNNSVENLEWVTRMENVHREFKDRIGRKNNLKADYLNWEKSSKVLPFDRTKLFSMYCQGLTQKQLANIFDISQSQVSAILRNQPGTSENAELFEKCWMWGQILEMLNGLRDQYLNTRDYKYFRLIRQILPMSYLYCSTVTMSYENIYNIVHQRKNHKLNEWSGIDNPDKPNFIAWARTLPYAKELIFLDEEV